MYTVVFIIALI